MNKIYTNIEQSKKLAKILPLESADYVIDTNMDNHIYKCNEILGLNNGILPCWSFNKLFDLLPKVNGKYPLLSRSKVNGKYFISYRIGFLDTKNHNELVDACVEMIEKLKENNLM